MWFFLRLWLSFLDYDKNKTYSYLVELQPSWISLEISDDRYGASILVDSEVGWCRVYSKHTVCWCLQGAWIIHIQTIRMNNLSQQGYNI